MSFFYSLACCNELRVIELRGIGLCGIELRGIEIQLQNQEWPQMQT